MDRPWRARILDWPEALQPPIPTTPLNKGKEAPELKAELGWITGLSLPVQCSLYNMPSGPLGSFQIQAPGDQFFPLGFTTSIPRVSKSIEREGRLVVPGLEKGGSRE